MKLSSKANLYLLVATFMWGVTFPLIRNALHEVDAFTFVFLRFALAALLLFPFISRFLKKTTPALLWGGLLIGFFNAVAYLSQTIGLITVSSARGAFITGASVIWVPLLAPLFGLTRPTRLDFICAGIGFLGLYILTGLSQFHLSSGDLWILLTSFSFALQILFLQRLNLAITHYPLFTFYQILFTLPYLLPGLGHPSFSAALQPAALIGILFCAIFATSLAYYLQNKYQKHSSAPKAVLIYALEPVFASLLGLILNGEPLSKEIFYGGSILLLSLFLPSLLSLFKQRVNAIKL